jgi:hypothetical protein
VESNIAQVESIGNNGGRGAMQCDKLFGDIQCLIKRETQACPLL